jgi:hypothetical protein
MKRCQICKRNNVGIEHRWFIQNISAVLKNGLLVCDECNLCLDEQVCQILEEILRERQNGIF